MINNFFKEAIQSNFYKPAVTGELEYYAKAFRKDGKKIEWKATIFYEEDAITWDFVEKDLHSGDGRIYRLKSNQIDKIEAWIIDLLEECLYDGKDYVLGVFVKRPGSDLCYYIGGTEDIPEAEYASFVAMEQDGVVVPSVMLFVDKVAYVYIERKKNSNDFEYRVYKNQSSDETGGLVTYDQEAPMFLSVVIEDLIPSIDIEGIKESENDIQLFWSSDF